MAAIRVDDISKIFAQYRYIPHNSALGLWAFTGLVGATGVWSIFSIGIFFAIRTYRAAKRADHRTAAAAAVCMILAYVIQAYGDMGFASWTGAVLMAASLATVNRLSVAVGGWPRTTRAVPKIALSEASPTSRACAPRQSVDRVRDSDATCGAARGPDGRPTRAHFWTSTSEPGPPCRR